MGAQQQFGLVRYEKDDAVAILTMDNEAQLNALSPGIRQGLHQGLEESDKDDAIRISIITGTGRAFCAGFDISTIETVKPFSPVGGRTFLRSVMSTLALGENVKKPVIAAVNGICFGGGLELAIGCDIIISSDKAKFGVPEIKMGLLPGFACIRLHQIIGKAKSKELIMRGEAISAEEAYHVNLVNKVVPHDKLMDEALAMARDIALYPPLSTQFAKSVVNRELGGAEMNYAENAMSFLFAIPEVEEGVKAFLEKRKPSWKK